MGHIIDCHKCAENLKWTIQHYIKKTSSLHKRNPHLVCYSIGNDTASQSYIRAKKRACEFCGIDFIHKHFDTNEINEEELCTLIKQDSKDTKVDGIMVQLPLPDHYSIYYISSFIEYTKDVDGINPINIGRLSSNHPKKFVPATPLGIMYLLGAEHFNPEGKNCVIIGRSNIVGKPIAQMLTNANATVTLCHSHTKNLDFYLKNADLVIVAVGKPNFLKSSQLATDKKVIVIDVGINRVEDETVDKGYRIVGDFDSTDAGDNIYFTPVPKGVGLMTVAALMENITYCNFYNN